MRRHDATSMMRLPPALPGVDPNRAKSGWNGKQRDSLATESDQDRLNPFSNRKKAIADRIKVIHGLFYPIADHLNPIVDRFYPIADRLKVIADGKKVIWVGFK